jgi:hypothetical protein
MLTLSGGFCIVNRFLHRVFPNEQVQTVGRITGAIIGRH